MLKIVLKHLIYEVCIEQFFTGVFKNFMVVKKNLWNIKTGNRYAKITVHHPSQIGLVGLHLYQCEIMDTIERTVCIRHMSWSEYDPHTGNATPVNLSASSEDFPDAMDYRINFEEIVNVIP